MKNPLLKSLLPANFLLLLLLGFLPGAVFAQSTGTASDAGASSQSKKKDDALKSTGNAETPAVFKEFRYDFEFGGQIRDVNGARPSKFEEFRRVPEGFVARRLRIVSNPAGSASFIRFIGIGVGEKDQQYFIDVGKYGRFRSTLIWDGLSHLYSRGSRSLYGRPVSGSFLISDEIQQTIQATPDAALPGVVQGFVNNSPVIDLRVKRQSFYFTQKINVTDNLSFRVRVWEQMRSGNRPLGTGSYERVGTATGDTFRVLSTEIPEVVDYRSDQVTIGASYVRSNWALNFDYTYSRFSNNIRSISFDNPFRITDMQATGAGGVFNRMAFASGLFALPPENHAHSFLIAGFIDLPHNSRWASAVGWSFWRQDTPFVPFTSNSAIIAANLPPGTTPTQLEALPQRSLEGEVDTWTQDHLFTSRVTDKIMLNVRYRYYDYNNTTEPILFPGYAAFGESFWRTNISGKLIENEPVSFRKQNAIAEFIWDINKRITWKGEYQWEGWERDNRQAARTNENTVGTQLSYRPNKRFSSKIIYRYSDRTPRVYNPGTLEFSQLRMFDQSKRLRHDVNLEWQWALRSDLGVSGTFGYLNDDYDQNFYGLTRYGQANGSVDLLYTPLETTSFYANYSREQDKSTLQQISKTATPFDLRNRWNRDERDVVDSFGAGVTTYFYKGKIYFDLNYAYSGATNRTTTFNLTAPAPNAVLNATAFPFPDVKSRFHEVNLDTNYQITPAYAFGLRYMYQPYRLNDFAWDSLTPYPVGSVPPEQDGRRFLFLDSRYSSHDANTVLFYFRLSK